MKHSLSVLVLALVVAPALADPPCQTTIFAPSLVPSFENFNDGQPIEVGTKFNTTVAGNVVGARLFVGSSNPGGNVATLWTASGTPLATASFPVFAGPGWSQVAFSSPVALTPGQTYIISNYSPSGWYSATNNAFNSAVINTPLRGLASGEDGPNGVYLYGGGFPVNTYQASNYFVDVVFESPCPQPVLPSSSLFDLTPSVGGNSNDAAAVNLGTKFTSDRAAWIKGVRFFKYPQNAGQHIGYLWSASGTLLASATFHGETASGWQEVLFPFPVSIEPNQTYIAAYHTSTGYYAFSGGFYNSAFVNGSLTAPASASVGGNGVFAYGSAGQFPDQHFNASNYWVDVVADIPLIDISWSTVDGGGGSSTDGTIFVSGTIGQSDAGRMIGAPYLSVASGYWGAASAAPECPADFNDDGLVDDADFVIFATSYNILLCSEPMMPLDCPADLNLDTFVDDADFVIFAAAYSELLCP